MMFVLSNFIVSFLLGITIGILQNTTNTDQTILLNIYQLALIIPSVAVGIRRMHDTDRSGWWIIVPIANFIFAIQKGTEETNRFGPAPEL